MDAFVVFLVAAFPKDAKRTRSAVIHQQFGERIISCLKNPLCIEDRNYRHLIKRSGFQLLDLPEAGIRDALVVQVKGEKENANDRTIMKGYRRVAIVEEFYHILKQIHDKDCLHAGSRKTYARVQSLYSYIPRVVVEKYLISGRPRHPQSQGLVEQAHYTLERMISAKVVECSDPSPPWSQWLPHIVYTMNTQVHDTTKQTPYELVFGQPPRAIFVPDVNFRGQLDEDVLKRPSEDVKKDKEEDDVGKEEVDEEKEEEDEEKEEEDEENEEEDARRKTRRMRRTKRNEERKTRRMRRKKKWSECNVEERNKTTAASDLPDSEVCDDHESDYDQDGNNNGHVALLKSNSRFWLPLRSTCLFARLQIRNI
eukprot:Em0011g665a